MQLSARLYDRKPSALSMEKRFTANPRTFLKTGMSSRPNLRPHMSHGLATPYLAPIGKEKVHLNLANLIKRGREGRENLMGDVRDREGFGNVLARSFLQVLQIEFWVTWVRLDSLWAGGGALTVGQSIHRLRTARQGPSRVCHPPLADPLRPRGRLSTVPIQCREKLGFRTSTITSNGGSVDVLPAHVSNGRPVGPRT